MVKVKLMDGSVLEVEQGSTILDVAKKISEGLARNATCGSIDGKVKDLRYAIEKDCELVIHTFKDDDLDGKKAYWHTTSHIMAQAIQRLFPGVKFAIGPAIENGFYYDFDVEKPFTDEDKAKIEAEMKKIIKENLPIERFSLPKKEALELMKDQPYKQELINDLADGEEISFYKQGDFTDLCAGPHLESTGKVKTIKILSSSGAYWRGDEHNKMLQRVYGISFPKASMLEDYMKYLEEIKERDHRRIGKEQELFMTHKLVGAGLPMYLPHGATVRRILERYIQDKEIALGYQHVYTPSLANVELYKTSGHWDHYKEDMFPAMKMDNEEMVLRPMNCPHHMLIYKNKMRSYRDLPIRIGELAHDFRYEASGSVVGLERVREMCQNDAHLFVRPDQIKDEVGRVIQLILSVYKDFGFEDYEFRLSLRDKKDKHKYFDDDEMWEKAESQLREILKELNINLMPTTAFRDEAFQRTLYTNYVNKEGVDKADTYSARPGYSEHQTGLSIDLKNTALSNVRLSDENYDWLENNAYKYGFIIRFPKNKEDITLYQFENWHIRYVGKDAAKTIYENKLTLEEYIDLYVIEY